MEPGAMSTHHLLTMNEREYLSKLCWLLHEAGTAALRVTFDNIHPPVLLKEHLSRAAVKTVLARLVKQKVLTDTEWTTLYPPAPKSVTSQKYDSKLLATLLQTICHICAPYPYGWNSLPLPSDISLSADVARMAIMFQQVGSLCGVRDEEYPMLWKQIGEVLLRLGGPAARIKIQRIDGELVPRDMQNYYIQLVKDTWITEKGSLMANLDAFFKSQPSKSAKLKGYRDKKNDDENIPAEDLYVMQKMHKMLTDNIIAEDILDRLQQGQIIKITDRQEILALSKNQDRMTKILDKVRDSKISYAFKLFCDSLKFKYPKEFDMVMNQRKETFKQGIKETIDLVSVCSNEMSFQYKVAFARCTPLPWLDSLHMCVRDFYTSPVLVDSDGEKLHLSEILPAESVAGKGKRVVIEGAPGCGQTTLAMMLAHTWANTRSYFNVKYDLLVYIDAQSVKDDDMRRIVHKYLLPENSKLLVNEFWSVLEANASRVLFLVDGFEESVSCPELVSIIRGTSFKASALLVLVKPDMRISRYFTADKKIFNIGLNDGGIVHCLKMYSQLVEMSPDKTDELVEIFENTESEIKNNLSSPFLCLAIVIVFKTCKDASVGDISTVAELMELFGQAMAKRFCTRQNIDLGKDELQVDIKKTIATLEHVAYTALCNNKWSFSDEQVVHATQKAMVTKFAMFIKSGLSGRWKMTCSLLSDFMAARYLGNMSLASLSEHLQEQRFITRQKHANMISYLCVLFRDDEDKLAPEKIISELNTNNFKLTERYTAKYAKPGEEKPTAANCRTTGHVTDYIHSFQGLSECKCRNDLVSLVTESMPNHMIIRIDGLLPHACVQGLSSVVRHESNNITHIEINLLPVYMYHPNTYLKLAEAMASSPTLRRLRVLWYSLELMAQFLVLATKNATPLKSIQIEDCSKQTATLVSAATWSNLQDFCTNLDTVEKFFFLNCKMASVVCHVIHHLPVTMEEMDFGGCAMNPICASEVATKIEFSKSLKKLNLNSTSLESSDVKALTQGLKLGESLQELSLGGSRLDISGMIALAESIRLSSSIQSLDLSHSELTTDLCKILASGIDECRTLMKLVVSHSKISYEGRMFITQAKDSRLELVGVQTLKYL